MRYHADTFDRATLRVFYDEHDDTWRIQVEGSTGHLVDLRITDEFDIELGTVVEDK